MRGLQFIQMMTPLTEGRKQVYLPVGKLAFLIMYLTGTNEAAKTAAMEDVGRLRLVRNSEDLHNTTHEFYHDLTDLKGGYPLIDSTAAAAFSASYKIPMALSGIPNVMDIRSKNEAYLDIDWDETALAVELASLNAYLYGFYVPEAVERYELFVHEQDIYAGAAGVFTVPMSGENIAAMYMKVATPANLTALGVTVDGESVWNGDEDILTAITNIMNHVESAGTWSEVLLTASGNPLMSIGHAIRVQATFGATDTLSIRKLSIRPSPIDKVRSSIVHAEVETGNMIARLRTSDEQGRMSLIANVPAIIRTPQHARVTIEGATRTSAVPVRRAHPT